MIIMFSVAAPVSKMYVMNVVECIIALGQTETYFSQTYTHTQVYYNQWWVIKKKRKCYCDLDILQQVMCMVHDRAGWAAPVSSHNINFPYM